MRKLALILLASLLLTQLLVALPSQAAAPFSSPLPALTATYSVKVTMDRYDYIPCALGGRGEDLYFSGDLHIVSHITVDPNGGYHYDHQFQPQGVSGLGTTSGVRYQATGITQDSGNFRSLPYSYTYVNNYRIIGQGPGNNFVVHENIHITINANGELTADASNFSVDCK